MIVLIVIGLLVGVHVWLRRWAMVLPSDWYATHGDPAVAWLLGQRWFKLLLCILAAGAAFLITFFLADHVLLPLLIPLEPRHG